MADVVIPTLGTTSYLTDPSTKIGYVLRQFAAAPKNATATFYNETISLQDILSRYAQDRDAVREPIIADLTRVYNNVFPDASAVTIDVQLQDVPEKAAYNIIIGVTVIIAGVPYTLKQTTTVSEDGRLVFGA